MKTKKSNEQRRYESMSKYFAKRINKSMPQMYAAMGIALLDYLPGTEEEKSNEVIEIFNKSQKVWTDALSNGDDVIKLFEERTGYEIDTHDHD